jgi:OmcA/MtrC family decaheme c-type cytochrome
MNKWYRAAVRAPWLLLIILSLIGAAQGVSKAAVDRGITRHDLAGLLDPAAATVPADFIRPGLVFSIKGVTITGQTVAVHFTMVDSSGVALDRLGVDTAGTVSTSFVMGYIPKGQEAQTIPLYSNYFLNTVTATTGGATATQPTGDSGGTYTTNADGDYVYTFGKQLPAGFDQTVTNTVAIYGSRNLTSFGLLTYYANTEYNFVPNGSPVTVTRQIVQNAACNQCHDPLSAHGGSRQDTALCILCHQPQNSDPNTGNNLDFTTMIHKIHMGASLPTTVAGGQYEIVGFGGAVSNFSTVVFPQYVGACTVCHQGAPQSNAYLNNPSRRACGACHDDVNFATGLNHVNLPEPDDTECAQCHVPKGENEFDASITGAHVNPLFSSQLPGTTYKLISATGKAGGSPTVVFSITDSKGNVIKPSAMSSLSLVMSGPTTDYGLAQNGTAAYISETATGATATGNNWTYTFTNKIPATATGTYAIGIEGYVNITINPGTVISQVVRDSGSPVVTYFSVDGSTVVPRRTVVTEANCDTCHGTLNAHGGFRRNVQYCILCHNPNGTDAPTRPAADLPAETIHFKELIHKVHNSANLVSTYTIYGFGGSVNNFNSILFPGNTQDCVKCHAAGTQNVPLPNGVLNTQTAREWITPTTQPMTAACTACHDDKASSAHALGNTSSILGESCDVCHGASGAYAVSTVHVP